MEVFNLKTAREALVAIAALCEGDGLLSQREERLTIRRIAKAALEKPPRNCDVGTADEQLDRQTLYCNKRYEERKSACLTCKPCPCYLEWAQLPYNESEFQ